MVELFTWTLADPACAIPPLKQLHDEIHDFFFRDKLDSGGSIFKTDLDDYLKSTGASFRCMKVIKEDNDAVYIYRIGAPNRNYDSVNNYLLTNKDVQSFDF